MAPQFQKRRVGTKLVRRLSQEARRIGIRTIIAETQPANGVAMDFYMECGFRLCGYNDRYYANSPRNCRQIAVFFSQDL